MASTSTQEATVTTEHILVTPKWKPIETAPKDASTVLVMKMHRGKILWAMSAYWDDNEPCPCRPPKCRPGTHRSWRSGLDRIADPTHWMPLLEPPVSVM